jgi:hypothetical protein
MVASTTQLMLLLLLVIVASCTLASAQRAVDGKGNNVANALQVS